MKLLFRAVFILLLWVVVSNTWAIESPPLYEGVIPVDKNGTSKDPKELMQILSVIFI